MKYVILFPLLSISSIFSMHMNKPYQLPSTQEIKERLTTKGFQSFTENSPIFAENGSIYQLGGKSERPSFICASVTCMLEEAKQQQENGTTKNYDIPERSIFMEILLKDHQGALKAVKEIDISRED